MGAIHCEGTMKKTPGRGSEVEGKAVSHDDQDHGRWQRTAVAAFFRAEARGFAPGMELDDWLAAEQETASGLKQVPTVPEAAPKKRTRPKSDMELAVAPSDSSRKKRATSKRASSSRQSQAGLSTREGGVA